MKKRRKPNLKNENSRTWKKKADDLWAAKIHDLGYCEICGRTGKMDAHHIISRTRLNFRHNLNNGISLCSRCHRFDADVSPHVDSFGAENFLEALKVKCPDKYRWYQDNKHDKRQRVETYKEAYSRLTT